LCRPFQKITNNFCEVSRKSRFIGIRDRESARHERKQGASRCGVFTGFLGSYTALYHLKVLGKHMVKSNHKINRRFLGNISCE